LFSKLNAVTRNEKFDSFHLAFNLADVITMKAMTKVECAKLVRQCLDTVMVPFLDHLRYPAAAAAAYCVVVNKIWPSRRFMVSFSTFVVGWRCYVFSSLPSVTIF
jgi:hypothetical protein